MRIGVVAGAFLLLTSTSWAAPEAGSAPAAAGADKAAGQPKAADPQAADAAPAEQPTPDAAAQATAAAVATGCKKAIGDLTRDPAGLKSLSKEEKAALVQAPMARDLLTCLAVASDDARYCDLLTGNEKQRCAGQRKDLRELKGVPKEQVKSATIFKVCSTDGDKGDCEKLRAAIAANDAAKCSGLPDKMMPFCQALAGSDASKCQGMPAGEDRSTCEAFASDDASRCLKESVNCIAIAQSFAAVKKDGLGGVAGIDASAAAVVKGKDACTEYATGLEKFCAGRN